MKKTIARLLVGFWVGGVLVGTLVHADPPKIVLPTSAYEPAQAEPAASEPISTAIPDEKDKNWKEYDNRIVKSHVRVKAAWPVVEIKETQNSGSVSFTLAHAPGTLVTFSISREPLDVPFEAWISSSSLAPLYPSGYQPSEAVLAGRKGTLIKGTAPDGRLDESYFLPQGLFIYQVSFTAPKESWKNYEQAFDALKKSFRWLP